MDEELIVFGTKEQMIDLFTTLELLGEVYTAAKALVMLFPNGDSDTTEYLNLLQKIENLESKYLGTIYN